MLYMMYTILEATIYLFNMLDVEEELNLTNIIYTVTTIEYTVISSLKKACSIPCIYF